MLTGMLSSKHHRASTSRGGPALLMRATVARTFGSLGGFLALTFLGAGIYLLQEAFTDPLRAQAVGLITGAFILALATMLLYFVFTPRSMSRVARSRRHFRRVITVPGPTVIAPPMAAPENESNKDMAVNA